MYVLSVGLERVREKKKYLPSWWVTLSYLLRIFPSTDDCMIQMPLSEVRVVTVWLTSLVAFYLKPLGLYNP